MTRAALIATWVLALSAFGSASRPAYLRAAPRASSQTSRPSDAELSADLDRIFADPVLARALVGIRVESLRDGRLLYARNSEKLVMPASNMKLLTMAVAADRLGWDFKYETRLEITGPIVDGVLHGDLIIVGGGDPSIAAQDVGPAPLFAEWADTLSAAGIRRVEGRLIGDDNYFDHEGLGAGWAWDYLGDGYAALTGALSYNENLAVVHLSPGKTPGDPVKIELSPPGHLLEVKNEVTTGVAGSAIEIEMRRLPGNPHLTIRGRVPALGETVESSAAVDNPTRFFVEGVRLVLAARGITISGGAWNIDDLPQPPEAAGRRVLARRQSLPLSALAGYFMKVSQNFYADTILKTIGRVAGGAGTAEAGRTIVRDTLGSWGVPADAFVMSDGSGLSRYNYVTAETIVTILRHVWEDERLRGPFVAALPVAGRDGTLDKRMKGTVLDAHVEAKTGTISNVRSLSGYLETKSGERLVFSIIANHFTAPSRQVDAVVERALSRLAER